MSEPNDPTDPLKSLGEWEDDVLARYPEEGKKSNRFDKPWRDYDNPGRDTVREFYRLNHLRQTVDFARGKRAEYAPLDKCRMGVWEACEYLNTLVDDSDPDTDLSQIQHLFQTSEAIRADATFT